MTTLTINQTRQLKQMLRLHPATYRRTRKALQRNWRYPDDKGRIIGSGLVRAYKLQPCSTCYKPRETCLCHKGSTPLCRTCNLRATTLHESGWLCNDCFNAIEKSDEIAAESVWRAIAQSIEDQPVIQVGKSVKVGCFGGRTLTMSRTKLERLRVRWQYEIDSFYVGLWGRDDGVISSAQAGRWKVAKGQEREFVIWYNNQSN